MYPKLLLPCILLAAVVMGTSVMLSATGTGRIAGTITDQETGDPVAGASVAVAGTKLVTTTDDSGQYVISGLEPGTYLVQITHSHYMCVQITDVVVEPALTAYASIGLAKANVGMDRVTEPTVGEEVIDKAEIEYFVTASKDAVANQSVISAPELTMQPAGVASKKSGEVYHHHRAARAGRGACYPYPAPIGHPTEGLGFPPAHGGTSIVNGQAFDAMFFKHHGVYPFVDTEDDNLSTFATDVDDAAYVMTRSYLERGALPPSDAVRTEEFINHFDYGYDAPGGEAFTVFPEGTPSRFGKNCHLLKIGIKGREIRPEKRKAANLVFVVDVSGSMAREDRLGLVRKALRLLVDELRSGDEVGIVVYGSRGRVVLEPTSVAERGRIVGAIESLVSGGSTNAEEGIRLGYEMAERNFERGKINRVILCSDGVANVGRTGPDDILREIERYADMGVTLSTIGFGMGNYNDVLMEKLGDKGNGHYAYVDNLPEARRIFVENLTGMLQVIARDVKIQVDFNPDVVRSYRLLGYENRDVDDDKFRDDREDGGEIGSGHEVTALYEVKFVKGAGSAKVGTIYIRYKDPETREVTEISRDVKRSVFAEHFDDAVTEFKLAAAAAEFAEILRGSYWAKDSDLGEVLALVKEISRETESDDVIELLSLISKARRFGEELAGR